MKKVILIIIKKIINLKWYFQRIHIKHLLINNLQNNVSKLDDILIIAPHADDELIGCNELITNKKLSLEVFYCSLLGSNYTKDNQKIREQEFRNYMSICNRNYTIAKNSTWEEELFRYIDYRRPKYIFLPSFVDWHDEHRLVNLKLLDALDQIGYEPQICWYNVSLPIPAKYVNAYSPLDKRKQRAKWLQLKQFYPSQSHMDIGRFKFIEANCNYKKYGIVEPYILMNYANWQSVMSLLLPHEKLLSDLKFTVGNIREMYLFTNQLYLTGFKCNDL